MLGRRYAHRAHNFSAERWHQSKAVLERMRNLFTTPDDDVQGDHRPDRTTMEGMIWNANDILKQALEPGAKGIPTVLAENAVAVVLITVAQAGFMFSGNLGTGIIVRKKPDGSWSHPSACGLTGLGWGFCVGASIKDLVIFINSDAGLDALMSETGLAIGGQAEVTVGPYGRTAELDLNVGSRGVGMTYSVAFSQGAFVGVSVQGSVIGARHAINMYFYNKDVSPRQILLEDDAVEFPPKWLSLMDEVYAKLIALTSSETFEDE